MAHSLNSGFSSLHTAATATTPTPTPTPTTKEEIGGYELPRITRMFPTQVEDIVQQWRTARDKIRIDNEWRACFHRELVLMGSNTVILRGLSGCGKSTFAAFLKIFAEVNLLTAEICSADRYFWSRRNGYVWNRDQLHQAHQRCQEHARHALARGVDFVIIDNPNLGPPEWGTYDAMAIGWDPHGYMNRQRIHTVTHVNFLVPNVETAVQFNRRGRATDDRVIRQDWRVYDSNHGEFWADVVVDPIQLGPPGRV
jgi:predicted kinase